MATAVVGDGPKTLLPLLLPDVVLLLLAFMDGTVSAFNEILATLCVRFSDLSPFASVLDAPLPTME